MTEKQLKKEREKLASTIKKAREEKMLTQRKLAEAANLGEQTVIRMEQLRQFPNVEPLLNVLDVLGLEIKYVKKG